jgi:cytochrome P450
MKRGHVNQPHSPQEPGLTSEFPADLPDSFDETPKRYEEIRKRCPVARSNDFGGFWALMKYDDIVAVSEDSEFFITSEQNVVPKIVKHGRRPPAHFDPPEHQFYRKPLESVFQAAKLRAREDQFAAYADELLDELVNNAHVDFAKDFGLPFAANAMAQVLDVPVQDMVRVRNTVAEYNYQVQLMNDDVIRSMSESLYQIARDVVAEKKLHPADPDLNMVAALLATADVPGEEISEEMVVACVRQFLVASMAATQMVLGSAVVHLARDARLQGELRAVPSLVPKAVEEFLRLYSPYRVMARTPLADVEIRGRTIKRGEPLALIYPSANRDEDVFEQPNEFRLDRTPNRHIAFGRGPHACPAAGMARVELKVALVRLLARTTSFSLAGPVEMMGWLEFGPRTVPLLLNT